MNEISVFRIDYEIKSPEEREAKMWTACIAAYSQQDAIDYLGAFLKKTFKIIQIGRECRLDALDDKVRQKVIEGYLKDESIRMKKELLKEKEKVMPKMEASHSSKQAEPTTGTDEKVDEEESTGRGRPLKKK